MVRTFGLQTIGAGPSQPWFGDVMTAAMVLPSADLATQHVQIPVADTTKYQAGDRLLLDPGAADQDIVLIDAIPSATLLLCRSEGDKSLSAHGSGTVICLDVACAAVQFQSVDGNTAFLWIGSDKTVTNAGLGKAFRQLSDITSPGIASEYTYAVANGSQNAVRTADGWIAGAAGDKYLVAAIVV